MTEKKNRIEGIDLFCGAGGLTWGLQEAGIDIKVGIDLDPACRYPFEENNGADFIQADIAQVKGKDLLKYYSPNAIRLLAGCAPCQPFSNYTNGKNSKDDQKWGLLLQFARLVTELKPELVTMENVPQTAEHQPFLTFIETLKSSGFKVDWAGVDCADYGVPQRRKRLVLVASRLGEIKLPPKTHTPQTWKTVRQAIGELPALKDGEADTSDPLHKASKLSPLNKKRILASKPGGTWRDWPQDLVAKCHKKKSGKTYPSVYGRMSWNQPAPTMTTLCYGYGNGRFGHPKQNRPISLREAAIFQSFPAQYAFSPLSAPAPTKNVSRLIGNAVPPRLGEVVGKTLVSHVADRSIKSRAA